MDSRVFYNCSPVFKYMEFIPTGMQWFGTDRASKNVGEPSTIFASCRGACLCAQHILLLLEAAVLLWRMSAIPVQVLDSWFDFTVYKQLHWVIWDTVSHRTEWPSPFSLALHCCGSLSASTLNGILNSRFLPSRLMFFTFKDAGFNRRRSRFMRAHTLYTIIRPPFIVTSFLYHDFLTLF